MLEYAGFLKPKSRNERKGGSKKLNKQIKDKEEMVFNDLLSQVIQTDENRSSYDVVVLIQKRVRGLLGRNQIRKTFMTLYVKK